MIGISSTTPKRIHRGSLGLVFFALLGLLCIAPVAAEAQSAGKRSATSAKRGSGTLRRSAAPMRRSATAQKRSTGSEKKGSLNSEKRGGDSFSATRRDDGFDEDRDASEWDGQGASDGYDEDAESSQDGEAEAAEEDFSSRTLGKACMYGVRGEVIFRPAGSRCRGDGAAAPEPAARSRRLDRANQPNRPKPKPKPKQPQEKALRREARSAEKPASSPRGNCMIGIDGRVLYAPPGVDCRR